MKQWIVKAFQKVDRKDFVLPEYTEYADVDEPLPIGHGQTISQPYTVAFMLELIEPQKGQRILDVGSGSGWTTALLAHIVGTKGRVYGTELIPDLVTFGKNNLKKYHFPHASIEQTGNILGLPKKGPFDRILVSAASAFIPQKLIDQLAVGGIMVIPIGNDVVKIKKISKKEITREAHSGFVFVPLLRRAREKKYYKKNCENGKSVYKYNGSPM
ncbi:MAG TPA: protein-L-isoaspartate O-methyltransferase [Candidatus Paceibacterota bacterium]